MLNHSFELFVCMLNTCSCVCGSVTCQCFRPTLLFWSTGSPLFVLCSSNCDTHSNPFLEVLDDNHSFYTIPRMSIAGHGSRKFLGISMICCPYFPATSP